MLYDCPSQKLLIPLILRSPLQHQALTSRLHLSRRTNNTSYEFTSIANIQNSALRMLPPLFSLVNARSKYQLIDVGNQRRDADDLALGVIIGELREALLRVPKRNTVPDPFDPQHVDRNDPVLLVTIEDPRTKQSDNLLSAAVIVNDSQPISSIGIIIKVEMRESTLR
jgi:hypothetical protein